MNFTKRLCLPAFSHHLPPHQHEVSGRGPSPLSVAAGPKQMEAQLRSIRADRFFTVKESAAQHQFIHRLAERRTNGAWHRGRRRGGEQLVTAFVSPLILQLKCYGHLILAYVCFYQRAQLRGMDPLHILTDLCVCVHAYECVLG